MRAAITKTIRLWLFIIFFAQQAEAQSQRPNITITLVGNTRNSDNSRFDSDIKIPNLANLVRGGLPITQFYHVLRGPSWASSLTSLTYNQTEAEQVAEELEYLAYKYYLNPNYTAEALKVADRSLMKGKWQVQLQPVYFTNGFRVTELTDKSAIIWTRLCSQETPNPIVHTRKETVFRHPLNFDENMPVENMDGGVKGATGMVKVTLVKGKHKLASTWYPVSQKNDFTAKIVFNNLKPNCCYEILLEGKASDKNIVTKVTGTFCTPPKNNSIVPVSLTSSTCQYFWSYDDDQRGFKTYDNMNKLNPDFFIQTGDYVYYDKPGPLATTSEKARHKWHAMDSWPSLINFYKNTPAYLLKDDHDLLADDASPLSKPYGELKFTDGLSIWQENVPLRDKPYRTFRWGKDLQIWLMEGREFRADNKVAESTEKTIWGAAQKKWLEETINKSDATFKLIFSPTPIVGPDRDNKFDNHANKIFEFEGNWIRDLLSGKKDTYVISGDRHWQYVSVDARTGLTEFGSGPVSDYHAQGWDPTDQRPQHKFLRVKGGFIGIKIYRQDKRPIIQFTHYDVNGNQVHEEKFNAK